MIGKTARVLAAAILASMMVVGVANATRLISPWSGRGANGPLGHVCMNIDIFNGSIVNGCGDEQPFIVPLYFDNSGSKNVTFWMSAEDVNDGCAAVTINRLGTGFSATAPAKPTPFAGYEEVTTGSVTVSSDNQFFADCILAAGARLATLSYAQ